MSHPELRLKSPSDNHATAFGGKNGFSISEQQVSPLRLSLVVAAGVQPHIVSADTLAAGTKKERAGLRYATSGQPSKIGMLMVGSSG